MLSRLTKAVEVNQIKDDLSNGDVNILIGTHSVISKNLKFDDLGLVIVDEEQKDLDTVFKDYSEYYNESSNSDDEDYSD